MNLVFAHGSASFPFECANAAIYAAEMPSGNLVGRRESVGANQPASTCRANLRLRSYGASDRDQEAVLPVFTRGCCRTRERP